MTLVFAAAAFSLANPQWGGEEENPDLIVIIDSSVSMNAEVGMGGATRFEQAKEKVAGWLKSIEGGTRIALATVDSDIHYHCSLTSNMHTLKQALDKISASQVPLFREAFSELSVLDSSLNDENHCRVIFLTDGAHCVDRLPSAVEVVPLDIGNDVNHGITAADIAALPGGKAKIFFTVSSVAKADTELEVELSHMKTGRIAKLITITVPAESTLSEVIEVDSVEDGIWSLSLSGEDIFKSDNKVLMGLNIPEPIGVSIDVNKPYFYTRCVEAFSAAENLLRLLPAGEARVVLGEGVVKSPLSMLFAPAAESGSKHWESVGEELEQIVVTEIIKDHPLIKHLNLDNIGFSGARDLVAPKGALVILEDISGVPLLYESKADGQRVVVANFQPSHDDFYLSPWFPIIVHNGVRFLVGREEEIPVVAQSGSVVSISTNEDSLLEDFYALDGSPAVSNEMGKQRVMKKLGGYAYKESKQTWFTGAAVLSEEESSSGFIEGEGAGIEVSAPSSGWPLAWWLLVGAVVIALAEEGLYHRRKVG